MPKKQVHVSAESMNYRNKEERTSARLGRKSHVTFYDVSSESACSQEVDDIDVMLLVRHMFLCMHLVLVRPTPLLI
jgi:hypothetical protein